MAQIYLYPKTFEVVTKCQLNNNRKKVVVDTYAAGITFTAGASYTIDLEEDFVKETGGSRFSNPSQTGFASFTVPSTGPAITSQTPTGTSVTNNTEITYVYERNILVGTGNFELYKETGATDQLVQSFDVATSNLITISGNQVTLNVTGLIDAGETYYVLIDTGAITDKDSIDAPGYSTDQGHNFSTAASTGDFPDLISLQASLGTLSCEPTKNPNYEYAQFVDSASFSITATGERYAAIANMTNNRTIVRDTSNEIFEFSTPQIEPPPGDTSTYSFTLTSNDGEFGDTDNLNTAYATYSFTGTYTQVNSQLEKIVFYPDTTFSAGGSSTATYTQNKDGVQQTQKTFALLNTNSVTDAINIRYEYIENSSVFTPNYVQTKYKRFHFLVVGAGGGGAGHSNALGGGGGGGGEVIYSIHEGISNPTAFSDITQLNISIGTGGALGTSDASAANPPTNATNGTAGGSTTMTINYTNSTTTTYTASGGDEGTISTGGDDGAGRYSGGSSYIASGRVYGGGGAGAGDLWYGASSGYAGDGFDADNLGTSAFPGYGFNEATQTGWGDNYLYGQGGPGTTQFGVGFIGTGDRSGSGAQFNYLGPGGTFQTTNGETIYQRGQGGAGSGRDYSISQTELGTGGQDGVVVLKYF